MTERQRPTARFVKPGEMLAMDPSRIHRGPQGFFWLFGDGPKPNERKGDVTIVHLRGELEHHEDEWGQCESYEGFLKRMSAAVTGQDCVDTHAKEHGFEDGYEPIAATPPSTIITCIDSPGGVVAGLNQTVRSLQKLRADNPKVQFIVWVNEMAASAAYAMACGAGSEIVCPRDSAIIGSIGVISTMISQARKNEKDGYDVVLLTSGARKADGHLHAPISDKAKEIEQGRVDKLALAFWGLASKARGLPIEKIKSFEAGIFLSGDAKKRGLVDAILSFDDLLLGASKAATQLGSTPKAGGNQTDRRLTNNEVSITPHSAEAAMPIALSALIRNTEAAIAKEKDPKKLASLYGHLAAYKKTEKHIEHQTTEEGEEGDEGDKDKDEDDEEDEEEEAAAAAAPPVKDKDEDDEEDEEESEEKSGKAALAAIESLTGMKGKKALGALQAIASTAANTAKDVAALKKAQVGSEKASLIKEATGKYITRKDAAWLATQKLATVKGFVEMRQKAGVIVNTDDSTLLRPKQAAPGTEGSLSAEALASIEEAVMHAPAALDKKHYRESLVKAHLEAHERTQLNGGRI